MISAAWSGVSSYALGSAAASPSAASSYAWSAQETSAQETSAQETSAQETESHETSAHETVLHAASAHETSAQETESHETFAFATSDQLTALNDRPPVRSLVMNWSSALFGLGGVLTAFALLTWISPTPTEPSGVPSTGLVDTISAPLTWSGVNSGCFARICAAAAEITGAANDVPESWMYPGATTLLAFSTASVDVAGTGPTM